MANGNIIPWLGNFDLRRVFNKERLKLGGVRIVSYPRSGRNWLRTMLHELSIDPVFAHAGAKNLHLNSPDTVCSDIPDYLGNRILFLLRDPRDVIVSHYHSRVRKKIWNGDLPGFVRDPGHGFERLLAFNLGWLEAHDQFRDFSAVRYEDLKQHTAIELTRIVGFLRCWIPGSQALLKVVAEHEFEQMKRREKSGELHARYGKHFTAGNENDNERAVRRGVIGSHVDEMGAADREYCETLLARYNYHANADRLIEQAASRGKSYS